MSNQKLKIMKATASYTRKNDHKWSKNDQVLAFYFTKFGTSNLSLNSDKKLADFIGVSVASLKMQSENFNSIMGFGGLEHTSKLQVDVYNEFGDMSRIQLRREVSKIIMDVERDEILRSLGKDPSKMKKLV